MPFGCNAIRNAFSGGSSNSGAASTSSRSLAWLRATISPQRSITIAGYCWCPSRIRCGASCTTPSAGSSNLVCGYAGTLYMSFWASGHQQLVAFAQRQIERFGEPDHHPAPRRRPAALQITQMPLRGARAQRQVELAQPGAAPATRARRYKPVHAAHPASRHRQFSPYPPGSCPPSRSRQTIPPVNDTIQYGLLLPASGVQLVEPANARALIDLAVDIERLGFDSVWAGDSLSRGRIEPLALLAAIAAVTDRVTLGTAALMPAFRHPVPAAQALSSLDLLSGGRLVLGVGGGYPGFSEQELGLVGVDPRTRCRWLDDVVELWRQLWSAGQPTAFHGRDPAPRLAARDPTALPPWWSADLVGGRQQTRAAADRSPLRRLAALPARRRRLRDRSRPDPRHRNRSRPRPRRDHACPVRHRVHRRGRAPRAGK